MAMTKSEWTEISVLLGRSLFLLESLHDLAFDTVNFPYVGQNFMCCLPYVSTGSSRIRWIICKKREVAGLNK